MRHINKRKVRLTYAILSHFQGEVIQNVRHGHPAAIEGEYLNHII